MHKALKRCLPIFLLLNSLAAMATPIDKLVVFGDSLSDNGNTYKLSYYYNRGQADRVEPRTPPYYQGHFSNGPVWVEDLAAHLFGESAAVNKLIDWAYGGSWVEDASASGQRFLPNLYQQIFLYEKTSFDFYPQNHLFIIWQGANDYLAARNDPETAATTVVKLIHEGIERLYLDGARHILLPLMPDFAKTPYGQSTATEVQQALTRVATLHNQKLLQAIAILQQAHPDLELITFDTQKFFSLLESTHHLDGINLSNTTTPCLTITAAHHARPFITPLLLPAQPQMALLATTTSEPLPLICSDPQNHLFWDGLHPTAVVHDLMAIEMAKQLTQDA